MIVVYQLTQGTLFIVMLSLLTILIFRNRGSPGFDFTRPKLSAVFPLEKWPQVSVGLSQKHFCSIHLVPLKIKNTFRVLSWVLTTRTGQMVALFESDQLQLYVVSPYILVLDF